MGFVVALFAKPIVKKLLPWIGGAIALSVLLFIVHARWDHYKQGLINQGRIMGRNDMAEVYREKIADNNAENRKVEKDAANALNDYKAKYDAERNKRISAEGQSKDKIEQKIIAHPDFYTNPSCTIPDDMLAERNRIRALGPK